MPSPAHTWEKARWPAGPSPASPSASGRRPPSSSESPIRRVWRWQAGQRGREPMSRSRKRDPLLAIRAGDDPHHLVVNVVRSEYGTRRSGGRTRGEARRRLRRVHGSGRLGQGFRPKSLGHSEPPAENKVPKSVRVTPDVLDWCNASVGLWQCFTGVPLRPPDPSLIFSP